jgi:ribonuclease P protein component
MIPKKYRFSLRSDPHFFEKASKLFFEFGVVFYVKNGISQESSQESSQKSSQSSIGKKLPTIAVAGIVPKKKWTKASQRNQHKRLLRAALTKVCQTYESTHQITLVVYLNKNPQSVERLADSLSKLVSKLS